MCKKAVGQVYAENIIYMKYNIGHSIIYLPIFKKK